MAKTIDVQIEKSKMLIDGLQRHVADRGEQGVTNGEIKAMEDALEALKKENEVVDRLRAELSGKVREMNKTLLEVKAAYMERKKMLKGYYPQERWADYGIPDKR